ncbi:sensor histidine kinase [Bacillus sp. DTU_2020_1000418_1_SI_GHA_SEK_038]|uniref:sensor histidine kinase n=1 Tax=Bacillus sp. DTU_2020_1000418_1_SI_GHA_SEK_038 TaxID=3077585 RepID=UPI0028EF0D23|nr:sensor histidine kinase [Bacillus sp. DTU_2020_1000418_1_SI_GHA_SEK_038]WNS76273.1 sensor histidine kinase [Bacillus sp. DTU_2020_1000418_1_SI_GHA_SEK_038]
MKNLSLLLLSSTRVLMFILLSSYYFQFAEPREGWKLSFIIGAMILFVGNHILQIFTESIRVRVFCTAVDMLLSFGFGAIFPSSGNLYLIFFGVISTTVFLFFSNRSILKWFSIAFFIMWILITLEKYYLFGSSAFSDNILNLMFIVFGAIVGSLIHNLQTARETISSQFQQLNDSHGALQNAHEQLSEYSNQVEQLTVIRERNEIAREIHDTVGHKMTALLVQLQLANEMISMDPEKSKAILSTCEQLTRDSLHEIRLSVRTLKEQDHLKVSFLHVLREMMDDFSSMTGMETVLYLDGDPSSVSLSLQPTIKRVVQEALTNAQRHGSANVCRVSIQITTEAVHIELHDNGKGTENVVPSFGLINMKERILEHGGTVQFNSAEGQGFSISIKLPNKFVQWSSAGVMK